MPSTLLKTIQHNVSLRAVLENNFCNKSPNHKRTFQEKLDKLKSADKASVKFNGMSAEDFESARNDAENSMQNLQSSSVAATQNSYIDQLLSMKYEDANQQLASTVTGVNMLETIKNLEQDMLIDNTKLDIHSNDDNSPDLSLGRTEINQQDHILNEAVQKLSPKQREVISHLEAMPKSENTQENTISIWKSSSKPGYFTYTLGEYKNGQPGFRQCSAEQLNSILNECSNVVIQRRSRSTLTDHSHRGNTSNQTATSVDARSSSSSALPPKLPPRNRHYAQEAYSKDHHVSGVMKKESESSPPLPPPRNPSNFTDHVHRGNISSKTSASVDTRSSSPPALPPKLPPRNMHDAQEAYNKAHHLNFKKTESAPSSPLPRSGNFFTKLFKK